VILGWARRHGVAVTAVALLLLDLLLRRLVVGGPYPGATLLLVLACGISMLPFLPRELERVSVRVSVAPALGVVVFAVLVTTLSTFGIALTEVSIRLGAAGLVSALALLHGLGTRSRPADRRDWVALGALVCVFAFALSSAWDIVGPFPPPGVDWGHYLLYADEVAAERKLLVEDRFSGEEGRLFADSAGIGALYGGALIIDGVESTRLAYGVIVLSALSPLTVFGAGAALWGVGAGLVAAGAYAVSPIHMDPIRWHGVGTVLALAYVPLIVLALALMYRGAREWRVSVLLGLGVLGVAVTHSTTTYVVVFLLCLALVVDAVRYVAVRRFAGAPLAWWRDGIARPLVLGLAFASVCGAAVLVHLYSQAANLGSPVSYRQFEPDWLSWPVIEDYYSLVFLGMVAISFGLALSSRSLRGDPAFLALVALATACVLVGELWRLEIPFEYRRVVQYLGIGMALLVGAASLRLRRSLWTAVAYVALFAYLAHLSVGFRLPERILTERTAKGTSAQELIRFRERIDRGELPDTRLVVADECVNFIVPYLLRRPTIVGFEPWQVGFETRVPLAERAQAVLAGGARGRRLAQRLGVGYVVANPACRPGLEELLGGHPVVETEEIVILDVRPTSAAP